MGLLLFFNLSKALKVLLICVAFVGQAMASTAMSYHMINMKVMNQATQEQSMTMMDHSHHNMNNSATDSVDEFTSENSNDNCCKQTCNCFTGGCSNFAAVIKATSYHSPAIELASAIHFNANLVLPQLSASLYRPPIFS